jgi:hypothetical protein
MGALALKLSELNIGNGFFVTEVVDFGFGEEETPADFTELGVGLDCEVLILSLQ